MPPHESTSSSTLDPQSWATADLPTLAIFESTLLCQICKDGYSAPVITPCGHTFCSLCMRRCLTKEQMCPTCRAPVQESTLKRNILVADILDKWLAAKGPLETALQNTNPLKTHIEDKALNTQPSETTTLDKVPRRSSRLKTTTEEETAQCPVCQKILPRKLIEGSHIVQCLNGNNNASSSGFSFPRSHTPSTTKSTARLAKLNYALLTPQSLKAKLQDLGLSTTGTRNTLEARHSEWLSLWNANLDTADDHRRKTRGELLAQLDEWEKTRKREGMRDLKKETREIDPMMWKRKYKEEFDELITQAKRTRTTITPKRKSESLEEEEPSEESKEESRINSMVDPTNLTISPTAPSLSSPFDIVDEK